MIYLTLAEGYDRWEMAGTRLKLKAEGELWQLASPMGGHWTPILKPEVADWCFDNIGAYRIIDHIPVPEPGQPVNVGPEHGDSWRIEFKTDTDMAFFKMRWG